MEAGGAVCDDDTTISQSSASVAAGGAAQGADGGGARGWQYPWLQGATRQEQVRLAKLHFEHLRIQFRSFEDPNRAIRGDDERSRLYLLGEFFGLAQHTSHIGPLRNQSTQMFGLFDLCSIFCRILCSFQPWQKLCTIVGSRVDIDRFRPTGEPFFVFRESVSRHAMPPQVGADTMYCTCYFFLDACVNSPNLQPRRMINTQQLVYYPPSLQPSARW